MGLVDIIISFLRVEGYLNPIFGDKMTIDLGRAAFRGKYVHYPIVIISFIIALFVRGLGFTWLSILVVIADIESAVHNVIPNEIIMINQVPKRPALPTTQPTLKYMITPRMVSKVGVNTPPKVPNFLS